MKKVLALILAVMMVLPLALTGCKTGDDTGKNGFDYDKIEDNPTSADGTYELAFVTDVGQLKDKSFNQGTWEGLKRYASENNKTYKYYQPANGNEATDDDRFDAMKAAVEGGAKLVVCVGFLQGTALTKAAIAYPDVNFVFIDGIVLTDADNNPLPNVASIDFQEEQSGYLAGYAAVMEGYTKLGFSGGGGGDNPACCRFGYGYVQGAQAAAAKKDVQVTIKYSWAFGSQYSASQDLQTMLNGWYGGGTEVIFACGGSMCQSAFAAASANQAKVIGVDVDQSSQSETIITSATKGLREAIMFVCEKLYADKWSEVGGKLSTLGAADDAVGLPTATWSMKNFSVEEYNTLFESMKKGDVTVSRNYENVFTETFNNVTVEEVK